MSTVKIIANFGKKIAVFAFSNDFEEISNKIKEKFKIKEKIALCYKKLNTSYICNSTDYLSFLEYVIKSNSDKINAEVEIVNDAFLKKKFEEAKASEVNMETQNDFSEISSSMKDTRNRKIGLETKGFYKHSYNTIEKIRVFRLRRKKDLVNAIQYDAKIKAFEEKEKAKQEKRDKKDFYNKDKRLLRKDKLKLNLERLPVISY
jgi:hypothetical protein